MFFLFCFQVHSQAGGRTCTALKKTPCAGPLGAGDGSGDGSASGPFRSRDGRGPFVRVPVPRLDHLHVQVWGIGLAGAREALLRCSAIWKEGHPSKSDGIYMGVGQIGSKRAPNPVRSTPPWLG